MPRFIKMIVLVVPLVLLLVVGVVAWLLAQLFGWVDEQCQEWFMSIWDPERK